MNPKLEAINEIYLQIQDYVDPLPEHYAKVFEASEDQFRQMLQMQEEALPDIRQIVPQLTREEIIEAYVEGSRLLQRNLSGYMGRDFHTDYIPVMTEAIKAQHNHTAWLFLQVLANHLGAEIEELVIIALDNSFLRDPAFSVARQLNLTRAIPKIREIANNPDVSDTIREMAQSTVQALEEGKPF